MDFRQCPGCQASVLDDDATECPFCGVSMSAKPSAAAKPAAAAASKTAANKPTAAPKEEPVKRTAPARKVGETVADEDDPFGVDTSAVAEAPKMSPKPAKGRMIRLVCPMCETPGFISSKMQGKDVKCCNPDCMVPVFKAPRPKKVEEDTDSKRRGPSSKVLGGAAIVVLLIGGLLFWGFYLSRQEGRPAENDSVLTPDYYEKNKQNDEVPEGGETKPVPAPQRMSLAEIKQQALSRIITAAQVREDNRKPYGRRMAAEAYAEVGDRKTAGEQLDRLRQVGSSVPYFNVEPLLMLGWNDFHQGKTEAANQTFQQAAESYKSLAQYGRQVVTAGIALAAVQASSDQTLEASRTLNALNADRARSSLAGLLEITRSLETYDLDGLIQSTSLELVTAPLAVATAVDIASHGLWDKAIAWALAQPNEAAQHDCLTALASVAAREAGLQGSSAGLEPLQGLTNLSPTGRVRVQAGLATGYLMAGNQSEAERLLGTALASFATLEVPTPATSPNVRQIHDSEGVANLGLPPAPGLETSALAAVQLARLQVLLGQKEAGWQTFAKAWDFTAAMAPGYSDIIKLKDDLGQRRDRLQALLNRDLNLRRDDDKDRAMRRFRGQLKDYDQIARRRFDLESEFLVEAVAWGFGDEVAALRKNPAGQIAKAAGQPYDRPGEDQGLLGAVSLAVQQFADGKFKESAETLAGYSQPGSSTEERRDQRALQLACRLVKQKQVNGLFDYVDALGNDWLMEDALEMTAALGVLQGQGPELWKRHLRVDLEPTQKIAFYRGLVAGVVAAEKQPKAKQTAAATQP